MSFVTYVSGRYLRTRQKRAFISLITILSIAGVTVGVMALIVVIAVMAGFETDLKSRIMGIRPHMEITRKTGRFHRLPACIINGQIHRRRGNGIGLYQDPGRAQNKKPGSRRHFERYRFRPWHRRHQRVWIPAVWRNRQPQIKGWEVTIGSPVSSWAKNWLPAWV